MATTYTLKTPVIAHKAFRAYLGVHAAAFEAFTTRKDTAQKFSNEQFGDFAARGLKIEDSVSALFSKAPKFVRRATPCGVATMAGLMPKRRVADLEAELEGLKAELSTMTKTAKKAVKKVAPKAAKKTATKTATKTVTKAAAKPARHIAYIENVRTYDVDASEAVIKKIVNHCGIALNSNDGKFVACSDESERATVRDSWLVKKLGLNGNVADLDAKVMNVCETMQAERMKSRVTFYYLLAKNEGKFASL